MRNVYVQNPVYSYVEAERSRRDGGALGLQEWQVGAGVMMRGDYGRVQDEGQNKGAVASEDGL